MSLADGFPSTHSYYDDDLNDPSQGQPMGFLTALLAQLAGAEPEVVPLGNRTESFSWERWGKVGAADTWLTWRGWGDVDDSSVYTERYEADLPTIRLDWTVDYWKSGYRHIPHHKGLWVEFLDPGAEEMFRRLWADIFSRAPHFVPAEQ